MYLAAAILSITLEKKNKPFYHRKCSGFEYYSGSYTNSSKDS